MHKAPANETVMGAMDIECQISKASREPSTLMASTASRAFPNRGIRVWGGRTLSDANREWRYINVRRLFIMGESIDEGTQWIVFEPKTQTCGPRSGETSGHSDTSGCGALFGATPQEAFYVKCDEEINPPEVRNLGQVITEIGGA